MTTTLIIGNGFDLQSGLKSSFTDYFNNKFSKDTQKILTNILEQFNELKKTTFSQGYRINILNMNYSTDKTKKDNEEKLQKMVEDNNNNTLNFLPKPNEIFFNFDEKELKLLHKLSFWDFVFFYQSNGGKSSENWYDVENTIYNILKDEDFLKYTFNIGLSYNLYSFLSNLFLSVFPNTRYTFPNNSAFSFLRSELLIFEKDFKEYLSNEIKDNVVYDYKSEKLLAILLDKKFTSINYLLSDVNILNFNYTNPFKKQVSFFNFSKPRTIKNIHGTLVKNNIIFGIDPKGIRTDDCRYIFTKTYRQLTSNLASSEQFLNFNSQNSNILIFYGHSLNSSDYSYFEAIFDKLNLYDSSTKLIFKYSIYTEKKREIITLEYIDRITKLLEEYASTLSNKDHKDNLVSRLLLENRLIIQEVPNLVL